MRQVSNYSDADLVLSLNNGDRKAFEVIYRRFVSDIYSYARRNIYRKEDCEEIVQEVFESLWLRHREVRVQVSLRAYLLGIVRIKVIHYFKKTAARRKYEEHYSLFEAVYQHMEGEEINHAAIQSTLDKLINELPERCQEALRLRLSRNLSNGDIARHMNITTRTVEAYMFRAFNHIRVSYRHYVNE